MAESSETKPRKIRPSSLRLWFLFGMVTIPPFVVFDAFKKWIGWGAAAGTAVGLVLFYFGAKDLAERGFFGAQIDRPRDLIRNWQQVLAAILCLVGLPVLVTWFGHTTSIFVIPMNLISGIFTGAGVLFVVLSRNLKEAPVSVDVPHLTGDFSLDLTVVDVARSALWYADLLGTRTRRDFRNDDGHLIHVILSHQSGLTIGLIQHEVHVSSKFDERSVGLDHLEFVVPDAEDVYKWAERLDELGVLHSGVKDFEHTAGVMVTFRDPDNIQLEFYALKPTTQS